MQPAGVYNFNPVLLGLEIVSVHKGLFINDVIIFGGYRVITRHFLAIPWGPPTPHLVRETPDKTDILRQNSECCAPDHS